MKRPSAFPANSPLKYRSRPAGGSALANASKPQADTFKEFAASELYCPKCNTAMPVREKQLLYLPNGGVSDYRCAQCGTVLGTRRG